MRTATFILAMMAMFTLSAAEVNLFKNGDFSEGTKHWLVLKGATLSDTVKYDGKKSACIKKDQQFWQSVTLEPGGIYELTFMVKGENIVAQNKNQGARIIIRGGKRYARGTANADGSNMTGSFEWKQAKNILKASYFTDKKLHFTLHLDTEGTCYFTNFKLVKIGSEKKAE